VLDMELVDVGSGVGKVQIPWAER